MTFTIIAMVSGIEFPLTISELRLENGRVFKNPILLEENWGRSIGSNLTVYKEQAGQRQIDKNVVKYLVDMEMDTPDETFKTGNIRVSGSGAVEVTGAAGLSVFGRQEREKIEKVLLPLRLATKARIMAIPAKVQGGDRGTVSINGLNEVMPEPPGVSTIVELTEAECTFITELADRISGVDIS